MDKALGLFPYAHRLLRVLGGAVACMRGAGYKPCCDFLTTKRPSFMLVTTMVPLSKYG